MNKLDWMIYAMMRKDDINAAKKFKTYCRQNDKLIKVNNNAFDIYNAKNWKIINDDGIDGYIEKMLYPRQLTKDEQSEIANGLHLTINSPYDCTGKAFTRWIEFYNVPSGCFIYHSVGFDC